MGKKTVCKGKCILRIRKSKFKAGASTQQTMWHLANGSKTGNRRRFGHTKRGNSQPQQGWNQTSVHGHRELCKDGLGMVPGL